MNRKQNKAPDKGSFPLDHFHECQAEAKKYSKCVERHQNLPKRCKEYQKQYLECRMEKGLMQRENFDKLGFTNDLSWETEEDEKRQLFDQIQKMKQNAFRNVVENIQKERAKND